VSTGPDADRARGTPLGSKTIRLTNAKLDPQQKPGTKVEVKGALSVVGAEDGITVMSPASRRSRVRVMTGTRRVLVAGAIAALAVAGCARSVPRRIRALT
jgi:hypothetical protein